MERTKLYLAHTGTQMHPEGQTIEEHLSATGKIAAEFAAEFGAEESGMIVGKMHDIGKYSDEFQKRLQGGSRVDHATAGAIGSSQRIDEYWKQEDGYG